MQPSSEDKMAQTPPFHRVPVDVMLYMADFLEPATQISMALTSKSLLNVLGKKCLDLPHPHKKNFLNSLECMSPNHLLCRVCWRFHPRHHHKSGKPGCPDPVCYLLRSSFNFGVQGYSLLFSDVQQIMNRARFGAKFGISKADIEFGRSKEFSRFPFPQTETIRAATWRKKLYLRVDTHTRFDRDNEVMKWAAIYCPREFCSNVRELNLNYDSFVEMGTSFARCSACKAEFRIKISWTNELEDTLRTTAWYHLGSVEDRYGIEWCKLNIQSGFELEGIGEKDAVCRRAFKRGMEKQKRAVPGQKPKRPADGGAGRGK